MTTQPQLASKTAVTWLSLLDAVLIIIFAMIGISSHDGALDIASVARVAIPFLVPYLALSLALKPRRFIHNVFPVGIGLWIATVILGPVLRAALFQDSSALAFILVTAGVLALFLIGRRIISTLVTRKQRSA